MNAQPWPMPSHSLGPVPRVVARLAPGPLNAALRDGALQVVREIREDHFPDLDEGTFLRRHVDHASPSMRAASYRFATAARLDALMACARAMVEAAGVSARFLMHPIFYLRLSSPERRSGAPSSEALLESQPHYDLSYGIPAYSLWLALLPRTELSGGICAFSPCPELAEAFAVNERGLNAYNYQTYVNAAERLDPLLRPRLIEPALDAGDAYLFDNTVLHGATRPKEASRLSFDFRIVFVDDVNRLRPAIRQLLEEFNADPERCNIKNLAALGDGKGVARLWKERGGDADEPPVAPATAEDFRRPGAVVRYQQEYGWLSV